jgi:hypothetical protein
MKRTFFLINLVIFCAFVYAQEIKRLEPLKDNETLEYIFDTGNSILQILKNNSSKTTNYYSIYNTSWGMYQITESKKGILFFEDTFEEKMPMYYLDGNKGTITLYGNIKFGARLDSTGKYVLLQESGLSDFFILNLETGNNEKGVSWNLHDKEHWYKHGAGFSLLRATDKDEYDYLIEFRIERLTIAKGYLNIEEGIIKTEFDDSDKKEIELRQSVNYGEAYTGWY